MKTNANIKTKKCSKKYWQILKKVYNNTKQKFNKHLEVFYDHKFAYKKYRDNRRYRNRF